MRYAGTEGVTGQVLFIAVSAMLEFISDCGIVNFIIAGPSVGVAFPMNTLPTHM
jgi:hypothetical protein